MNEDFGDVLSFFDNDSDENADSADEILGMLDDDGRTHKSNENNDDGEDDTDDQIAALQAQIELLKSKKGAKIKPSDKIKSEVSSDQSNKCKHGKILNECFFCSSKQPKSNALTEKKKSNEDGNRRTIKKEIKEESETRKEASKDSSNDIFAIIPEVQGENSIDLSKKRRLAHDPELRTNKDKDVPRKKVKVAEEKVVSAAVPKASNIRNNRDSGNAHCFAGIEVSNPVISSAIFDERTKGRKLVKISKIESTIRGNDIEGDWVTVGVVVRKVTQKKSSSGKNFSVWHLSDLCLGTENNVVGLFLFGNSYEEHWKIQVGRVIAILNAEINKQEDQQLSIKIDNAKKLMELGDAKFLGGCKGQRKSDGKPCTMYVNKRYGDYCEYHVQAAFKKAKSGRMDLQSGGLVPKNKGKMLKNLKKDISGGDYYYGGKTVTLQDEKLNSKPMNKSNESKSSGLKAFLNYKTRMQAALEYNTAKKKRELEEPSTKDISATDFLKMNKNELLNKGNSLTITSDKVLKKQEKVISSEKLNTNANSKSCVKMKNIDITGKSNFKPRLGRGLKSDDKLDFFFSNDDFCYEKHTGENPLTDDAAKFKKVMSKNLKTEMDNKHTPVRSLKAKQRAISLVKNKGPIELENPNIDIVKNSSKVKNVEKVLKNCEKGSEKNDSVEGGEEKKKKKGFLSGVLGHIDINSDEGKKLLQQKSKHVGAVKLAEAEREEKYFNSLEKKEMMAEKSTSVYQIKVSGVACRECHYLAESQSEMCKELNHAIAKIPNIIKRFFVCKACKTRCCSYNKALPKNPCLRCGESNFEKTSMGVERKGPLIGGETLQVADSERGLLYSF